MDSNREKTQDCLTRASWAGFYTEWHGLEGDRTESVYSCDLKKIKYNKVNSNFFFHDQFQRSVLVLFAQGVYVPGGMCPRG